MKCKNCDDPITPSGHYQLFCSGRCRQILHNRLYRTRYPDKVKRCKQQSYLNHREKTLAYNRQWMRDNPERSLQTVKRNIRKRRTLLRWGRMLVSTITAPEWSIILDVWGHKCAYCGTDKQITQDHLIPLSKGGQDTLENIVPACRSCNSSKKDRTIEEFLTFQERRV